MSTRDSRRLRQSLSAVAVVVALLLVCVASLQAVARKAEATGEVYPYKSEDWLRYLLPTLWPADRTPLVVLAGPSTARENLLVEGFRDAFPGHRVYQGGLSVGTLGDVMSALAYVERAHGRDALPEHLVLGVSPRFLAEIPAERPFALGLDAYSPHYRASTAAATGFGLAEKSAVEGALSKARFIATKQGPRYQAALVWLAARALDDESPAASLGDPPAPWFRESAFARRLLPPRLLTVGLRQHAAELVSPYKYRGVPAYDIDSLTAWLDDPESWWADVYRWDPAADADSVRARAASLLEFAAARGIRVYVVNLPERALSRARYAPGTRAAYVQLVREAFAGVPVLDIRCLLDDADYLDAEHALPPGAARVTERVTGFIGQLGGGGAGASPASESPTTVNARWEAPCDEAA